MLKNGIYEQIINENINQELIDKNDEKHIEKETVIMQNHQKYLPSTI